MQSSVTLGSIQSAKARISGFARRTPIERSLWLSSSRPGEDTDVLLKLECFQATGSFKIRGAAAKLTSLSEEEKSRGILTVSAGNHGLAVAYSAQIMGLRATIVVPETASRAKVEAIRRYPVRLLEYGASYDEAERAARRMERETGLVFVSPYNDPEVIAGQGTVALEILEDDSNLDAIVVPVGGGGLLAGVLVASKAVRPDIKVYGVEPAASPTMQRALDAGEIVEIVEQDTIADGLAGNIEPESITFPIIQELVDGIISVDEISIRRAMTDLANADHIMVEGLAAATVAGLDDPRLRRARIALIITGRNVSLDVFREAVTPK